MTTFIKILLPIILFIISNDLEAKTSTKQDEKVDVKCFVELVGGREMVSFWNVSQNKASNLSNSITGHKVMLPGSKQKVKIYKVYECILSKADFTGSRAKIVDGETAR
ncbi:TapY2 family type IVa secretion system protein [Colwellia piezophila]|uniref:TapY2 family type IVa secretion system protein n=1 Tax=Colwellia piezophila TaxID=211668 RepID=UPI000365ADE4|nr:TapY2 family type IVa secretion system protein [Colwellia piezophila]